MEKNIEEAFIAKLQDLKYSYRPDIVDRKTLEQNFRQKFEQLNRVHLSENEFLRLREDIINPDVFSASKFLREEQYFEREDGTPLYYTLVNTNEWCKNDYEVIHQLRMNTKNTQQRYDVILLINGLPLVQIELKNLDISPRKAMQQIVDYKNEPGNGYGNSLLCFMQLFIVSNKTNTYYFINNIKKHFAFNADEQFLPVYRLADEKNKKITHLYEFAEKFLSKCTLGELLSKYIVLVESERKLLVMRPYQIYAVKVIVDCIKENRGNGYIWHTTGSGKTLTSFKASTLLKRNPNIEKCLFVVDRKDLDRQTREEFNKFQEGCVEENTDTETLVRRLLSTDYADKVIVTTIQKLGLALSNRNNYKERLLPLREQRIVIIFDECHRSQFGDNHQAIKEFFPRAQLFGFTGTPIFPDNAVHTKREGEYATSVTTEDIFQKQLHAYTITHAIEDKNVLRFHIDYFGEKEKTLATSNTPITQQGIVEAILSKHNAATDSRRFNALFATASINDAIQYYRLFKQKQKERKDAQPDYIPLNIACVFSPPAQLLAQNGDKQSQKNAADIKQFQEDLRQEKIDNQEEPEKKKQALMGIIDDYNTQYGTHHSINEFDLYYQDVQQRIKDQQYGNKDYPHKNKIDITIVVDMLLTGFDSKYLNTLYVDKNLRYHSLIQAFSRTNRVLNDTKPYGNILDFRFQRNAVDEAIALFSGEDSARAREIWLVDPAPAIIEKYKHAVKNLYEFMQDQNLACKPEEVYSLKGDTARIAFIKTFKEIQRLKRLLDQYTDLDDTQKAEIGAILPAEKLQEFRSSYLETAKQFTEKQNKDGETTPDAQSVDPEFVLFSSVVIDYDYIMNLVADSTQKKPAKQKMTKAQIINLLKSSADLMDEYEDLTEYIESIDWSVGWDSAALRDGYKTFKKEKKEKGLIDIAQKHGLKKEALKDFIDEIMDRMIFDGEKLTDLLAPLELSWKARRKKELALMEDLLPYLKKIANGQEISGLSAYE